MNRKRTAKNLSFGSLVFLVLVAVVLATAGVFYAYIKNQQVKVARSTEKAEHRIGQLEMDIKTLQMHLDQQLNRYLLHDRLRQSGSSLIPIPLNVVEEIDHRASLRSPDPDIAHRGP